MWPKIFRVSNVLQSHVLASDGDVSCDLASVKVFLGNRAVVLCATSVLGADTVSIYLCSAGVEHTVVVLRNCKCLRNS